MNKDAVAVAVLCVFGPDFVDDGLSHFQKAMFSNKAQFAKMKQLLTSSNPIFQQKFNRDQISKFLEDAMVFSTSQTQQGLSHCRPFSIHTIQEGLNIFSQFFAKSSFIQSTKFFSVRHGFQKSI
jgi:hypothetical protein